MKHKNLISKTHLDNSKKNIPVVILSGWAMPAFILKSFAKKFKSYNVYLLDLPGIGQKSHLQISASLESYAQYFFNEVPEYAIWIGWSLGGLVATYIASQHPEKVHALINIASSPCFLTNKKEELCWPGVDKKHVLNISNNLQEDFKKTIQHFLQLQFFGLEDPKNKDILENLKNISFEENIPYKKNIENGMKLIESTDLRSKLNKINVPILYLLGALDRIVPQKIIHHLHHFNKKINFKVLEKASHIPFLTHTDLCFRHIQHFLEEHHHEAV